MQTPSPTALYVENNSAAQHALNKLRHSLLLQPWEVSGLRKCLTEIVAVQPDHAEAVADLKTLDMRYPRAMECPADNPERVADTVNHPAHYTAGGVECIDAIAAAATGLEGIEAACTANAIKYLWRWKRKNGLEDLRKARWYINHLLGEN